MLRQTVILISLAAAAQATPQDQTGGVASAGIPGRNEVRICSLNKDGSPVAGGCAVKKFYGVQCGTQACRTIKIEPQSSGKELWTLGFEAGMNMICNVWTGMKCDGPPITAKRDRKAQVVLTPGNMTISYNCHNALGISESIELSL
jgi:hypothetical protein